MPNSFAQQQEIQQWDIGFRDLRQRPLFSLIYGLFDVAFFPASASSFRHASAPSVRL
ncbi:hypothetical protein H1R20_g13440, partial [Candolleomyces eurysporus]